MPFGKGDYCLVVLDPFGGYEDEVFGGGSQSFSLDCRLAPLTVEKEAALKFARGRMPGWTVEWDDVQGMTATRRVDLSGGMTVEAIGRLVPRLIDEAAPVCLRYKNFEEERCFQYGR